jgi:hypothetical protein
MDGSAPTQCAICGAARSAGSPDTWFFVAWPSGSKYLCSRACLVKWVNDNGPTSSLTRLKTGGYHIITPHRRE